MPDLDVKNENHFSRSRYVRDRGRDRFGKTSKVEIYNERNYLGNLCKIKLTKGTTFVISDANRKVFPFYIFLLDTLNFRITNLRFNIISKIPTNLQLITTLQLQYTIYN